MMCMKRLLSVVGAAALLATSVVPAAAAGEGDPPLDLQTRLDEFVGLVPGGAAAVTIRDGVMTTAASGIADAAGDPMEVDTPMVVGGAGATLVYALALQLVDAGLLDLDAPVVNYLPDAPVGEGATVRDVLESRAGIPRVLDKVLELSAQDPERTWTPDDMVALADRSEIKPAGTFEPNPAGTFVTYQLISAATGTDFATALADRISGPLGLATTVYPEAGVALPSGVAGAWATVSDGEPSYTDGSQDAASALRPTISSAADLATFMSALLDGQVVSPDLMSQTMFNESLPVISAGFLRPDEMFSELGPLDARYFGYYGGNPSGVNGALAGAPASGDAVVVLANNEDLDAYALVRDIVQSWAPDPLASGDLSDAEGTYRYTILFSCQVRPSPFDLPACEQDGPESHLPYEGPIELAGTISGSATMSGEWIENVEDGTFRYSGRGKFFGDVEGCGFGTYYFSNEGEGFRDETGTQTYTRNTTTFLPGGSLPLAGSYDSPGAEVNHADDTTTGTYTGSYTCG